MTLLTTRRVRATERGLAVPWSFVLPVAVLLSLADGYWIASMRGAVGSIERAQEPFLAWMRQSVLTLPLYVLAVVGALGLAMRRFGRAPTGRRAVWTGVFVAAAGAGVAFLLLVLGALVDLRLQQGHVEMMSHMTPGCGDPCLAQIEADGLSTAVRGVVWGTVLVAVTNVALLAWVVAALGGRVPTARRRRARPTPLTPSTPSTPSRAGIDTRCAVLAATLVGSGLIHLAVVPEHLEEWPLAGVFFVGLTLAEVAVAAALPLRSRGAGVPEVTGGPVAVADRRRRAVLAWAAVVGAAPLLVWFVSRSIGLPFGPEAGRAEAIGEADLAAVLLELVTVALAGALLLGRPEPGRDRRLPAAHARGMALLAVLAVTVAGLAGAAPDVAGDLTGPATVVTTSVTGTGSDHGDPGVDGPDAAPGVGGGAGAP